MMNFRSIKQSIIDILETEASGRFEVIQAQRQKEGSIDINTLKKVAVFYVSTDITKNAGTVNGEVQTDPVFQIELKVSAKGTVTDLTDPTTINSAEIEADSMMDELIDDVYQILMDARNMDLGLDIGIVANRYIASIEKGVPNVHGEYVVLPGRMDLSCRTAESVLGETGVEGTSVKSTLTMDDDTFAQTAIDVTP